ncbi:hypothetical protein FACS1894219_12450 [Clostridia bacterium]|nr:hypothetical protein FACS1894219_12450 [Clostridia bacterium]
MQAATLETEFTEGKDYTVTANGIMPLANMTMPFIPFDEFYLEDGSKYSSFPTEGNFRGFLRFEEGSFFHERQIVITYTHAEENPVYPRKGGKLPGLYRKLDEAETIKIFVNGDSITEGYNASGFVNAPPYQSAYPGIFAEKFAALFNVQTEIVNIASAGKNSSWGVTVTAKYLMENPDYVPDIFICAFGMNDGSLSASKHTDLIRKIIAPVRERNPDCAIVLAATMLPNPLLPGFSQNQAEYAPALLELEDEIPECVVADVTSVHSEILTRKRYYDMTGNNVNHPNDFLHRIYAEVITDAVSK